MVAGAGGFAKIGTGTLYLGGANTYDGETLIIEGVLRATNDAALGNTDGNTAVAPGAALELVNNIDIPLGETLSLSGTGISGGGALRNLIGDNSWAGNIILLDVAGTHRINSDSETADAQRKHQHFRQPQGLDLRWGGGRYSKRRHRGRQHPTDQGWPGDSDVGGSEHLHRHDHNHRRQAPIGGIECDSGHLQCCSERGHARYGWKFGHGGNPYGLCRFCH